MSDPTSDDREWHVRHYWQAIGPACALLWRVANLGEGVRTTGPHGIVMYQDIDFESLRSIPLSRLQPVVSGYPEFHHDEAPTPEEITKAWKRSASVRARESSKQSGFVAPFPARMDGETADQFYARVADFYSSIYMLGQPTTSIATASGVPKTTAARWVREARKRGFLRAARGRGKA